MNARATGDETDRPCQSGGVRGPAWCRKKTYRVVDLGEEASACDWERARGRRCQIENVRSVDNQRRSANPQNMPPTQGSTETALAQRKHWPKGSTDISLAQRKHGHSTDPKEALAQRKHGHSTDPKEALAQRKHGLSAGPKEAWTLY